MAKLAHSKLLSERTRFPKSIWSYNMQNIMRRLAMEREELSLIFHYKYCPAELFGSGMPVVVQHTPFVHHRDVQYIET